METAISRDRVVRFGAFQLNVVTGELRKYNLRLKLRPQSAKVLLVLVTHPGETVTREQLKQEVWGNGLFVDFEHSLNECMRQIRAALDDTADKPRYIETVPRCGYRFIAHIEEPASNGGASPKGAAVLPTPRLHPEKYPTGRRLAARRQWRALAIVGVGLLLAVGITSLSLSGFHRRLLRKLEPVRVQSLAVLPLANLSGDPTQEYFADGMTDDLITDLAKISGLRVISRTSVMRYKGAAVPLPHIGKELNVDAVVEGSVARAGGRIRITAQLVEASTDRHLWADSYERNTRDVLQLQDDVARAIANQVAAKLTPGQQPRLVSTRQINPEAYDLYLKGRYLFSKRGEENLNDSLAYFQQAIALDPNFAVVYAGIAQSHGVLGSNGDAAAEEVYPKAKAAALKALELDPNLSDAHVALAEVINDYEWNWPAAEEEYKRAIQLDPNNATAHHWYALMLAWLGRSEEAIAEIEEARRLDPLSTRVNHNVATVLFFARQNDRAIAEAQKTIILDPNDAGPHYILAFVYLQKKTYPEAVAEMQRAVALDDARHAQHAFADTWLAQAYAAAGEKQQALAILKRVKAVGRRTWVSPTVIAAVYAGLGQKDEAFAWLQKAFAEHDPRLGTLKVMPAFDPLRSDPRFADLLRRRHLPV